MNEGKHWAIQTESNRPPEYVPGDKATTAKEAERYWRDHRRIYFLAITVRRTTPDEDRQLEDTEQ